MKIFSSLSHCVLTFLLTLGGNKDGGLRKDNPLDSELNSKVQNAHLSQQIKYHPMRTVAKRKW